MTEQVIEQAVEPTTTEPVTEQTTDTTPVVENKPEISQEEFNKLYFEMKQAQRERDEAIARTSQPSTAAPITPDAEPTLEQFEYDQEKFTKALIEYKVQEGVKAAVKGYETSQKQRQAQTQQQTAQAEFNSKAAVYAAANPSYKEVLTNVGEKVQYSPGVAEAILTSDNGPALDHALLSNPKLLFEINALPHNKQLMELGKLEAKIASGVTTTPAKKVSNAPTPITDVAVGGNSAVKDYAYDENLSMQEYYAAHMAKITKKV